MRYCYNFGGYYLCADFGENRFINGTLKLRTHEDANWVYIMFHAASYWADNCMFVCCFGYYSRLYNNSMRAVPILAGCTWPACQLIVVLYSAVY